MKGTRLWQQAGSPLIVGESRRRRPFAKDWLVASAAAAAVGAVAIVAVMVWNGTGLETALRAVWMPSVPAAAAGVLPGLWLADRMGWNNRWLSGAVFGTIIVAVATAGFLAFLVSRLG
jgi:hypothetical protein